MPRRTQPEWTSSLALRMHAPALLGGSPWRVLGILLLAGASSFGCVVSQASFGNSLPDSSGLEVGVHTRRDVLDLLGPPDEYARPTPWPGRVLDPQVIRVENEHQLFDRQRFTWVREVRTDRLFLGWVIFNYNHRRHDAERLVVTFDSEGRVAAIGRESLP